MASPHASPVPNHNASSNNSSPPASSPSFVASSLYPFLPPSHTSIVSTPHTSPSTNTPSSNSLAGPGILERLDHVRPIDYAIMTYWAMKVESLTAQQNRRLARRTALAGVHNDTRRYNSLRAQAEERFERFFSYHQTILLSISKLQFIDQRYVDPVGCERKKNLEVTTYMGTPLTRMYDLTYGQHVLNVQSLLDRKETEVIHLHFKWFYFQTVTGEDFSSMEEDFRQLNREMEHKVRERAALRCQLDKWTKTWEHERASIRSVLNEMGVNEWNPDLPNSAYILRLLRLTCEPHRAF
jgi:hypothetical protein